MSAKKIAKRREMKVLCRRLGTPLAVAAHLDCQHCFGSEEDIASGDHERFCDFHEETAVALGSPEPAGGCSRSSFETT